MRNTKLIIPIVLIVLLLGGGAAYVFLFTSPSQKAASTTNLTQADSVSNDKDSVPTTIDRPDNALNFDINEGSAMYVAQKRFLSREDDVVIGTTNDVSGNGWLNPESGTLFLDVQLGLQDLVTGDDQRDSDVQKIFTDKIAKFTVDMNVANNFEAGEDFSLNVSGNLTVLGITRNVTFAVNGAVTNDGFTATGTSLIKMSDFGINPPSLASVFTVDDEIELRFDVTGEAVVPSNGL